MYVSITPHKKIDIVDGQYLSLTSEICL